MGIIFNTRDVLGCLAEVKGASAMMWVLFLIPVMCGSRSGDGGACSKVAWVLFLIPMMCGSRSGDGGACSKIAWVLILIPVMCEMLESRRERHALK